MMPNQRKNWNGGPLVDGRCGFPRCAAKRLQSLDHLFGAGLLMDDDVPPHECQSAPGQQKRHQRDQEIPYQRPVGHRLAVDLQAARLRRRGQRLEQGDEHVARIDFLETRDPGRHGYARLLLRQARRDLRIDHRPADDVDEIEEREEEAREHRGGVELHHRLTGNGGVDDDHHRGRNQDAERAACGDHAGRKLHVVAGTQHRVERDHAHQHDHGADEARGDAPEGADDQRRDGERGRHAPERELDRIEHLVDQRAALHHVAHQHEQRDGDEHVVGHRAVGAMDHQVEHAVLPPVLRRIEERDVAEEDSEPHQREGRGEAHHDHDHDEHEHQQPEHGFADDHVCKSPPMPRWRASSSILCARSIAALRVSSSTCSLCASCSSTTSISADVLQAARPLAGLAGRRRSGRSRPLPEAAPARRRSE